MSVGVWWRSSVDWIWSCPSCTLVSHLDLGRTTGIFAQITSWNIGKWASSSFFFFFFFFFFLKKSIPRVSRNWDGSWHLHSVWSWTSHENRGGRISLTYGTGSTLPRSCEETLYRTASVARTNSSRPILTEGFLPLFCYCLTVTDFGGPSKEVVLSHLLSYEKQWIFLLFRSCKSLLCIDLHVSVFIYVQNSM